MKIIYKDTIIDRIAKLKCELDKEGRAGTVSQLLLSTAELEELESLLYKRRPHFAYPAPSYTTFLDVVRAGGIYVLSLKIGVDE